MLRLDIIRTLVRVRSGTHYADCYMNHIHCAASTLLAEVEGLRAALIQAGSFIGRDCPEAERDAVLNAIAAALGIDREVAP